MKIKENFKRFVTGTLCLTTFAMFQPTLPAYAEQESEEFKYTMFASSNEEGAITVNSNNFTINGQIATNGTVNCTGNTNINYENSNNICVDMVYIPNKIDSDFFDGRKIDCIENDYNIEETNIDVSSPLSVNGITTMQGNVTIQAGIKSKDDICISGDVKNSYNTVIYSQYGDINIDCNNVSLNGLIYAPFGTIHITASNLNMNDTMIIANNIIIDAPNVNVNYSEHFGAYFNEISDKMEIPEEDFCYLEDLNDNNIPDFFENSINWKYIDDTDGDGIPDIIEISTGTDPEVPDSDMNDILDNYTLEMMYKNPLLIWNNESSSLNLYGDLNSDYIIDAFDLVLMRQMIINNDYSKYADLDDDGDVDIEDLNWLSNYLLLKVKSFPVYNNFDSDGDGLTDYVEVENYGTNPHKADTDGDGLSDYFEIVWMETNPLKADGIAYEDPDEDGLTNEQEDKYNTDPYSKDTDGDGLTDSEEIEKGTNQLLEDTDSDGLSDGDEVAMGLDPNNPKSNGVELDSGRVLSQTISEDDPLLSEINTKDNAYILSIDITASGNAKRLLNVKKSGYTNVMKDGSVVGFIPEFNYPDEYEVNFITLNFRLKEKYKDNVIHSFGDNGYITDDAFKGVNRFIVFKYFEEIDMKMPIEKVCKINGDTVSVTLPKESFETDYAENSYHNIGSYALVDLELWGMMMNGTLDCNNEMYMSEESSESNIEDNSNTSIMSEINSMVIDSVVNYSTSVSNSTYESSNFNKNNIHILNGHVYKVVEEPIYHNGSDISRWTFVVEKCKVMGGHLMTINSYSEYYALQSYFTNGDTTNCYMLGAINQHYDGWALYNYNGIQEDSGCLNDIMNNLGGNNTDLTNLVKYNIGSYLYYADGLNYMLAADNDIGWSFNRDIVGYVCEWDSYSDYINYANSADSVNVNSTIVPSFSGAYLLNGEISSTSGIDTDGDGIPDYDEMNWKLLEGVYGKGTTKTKVSYIKTYNCLSNSPVNGALISEYSNISKVNKVLNKTAGSTNLSEMAHVIYINVNPVDKSGVSDDADGDFIPDDEDGDRMKKFDQTPIIMDAIDDSDMIDDEGKTNIRSKISDNLPKNTVMKSDKSRVVSNSTIGGGTNEIIDMENGNNKIATIYDRDDRFDFMEFEIREDDKVSCIIVEIEFGSDSNYISDSVVTRNINYMDENFVRFYKPSDYRTSFIVNKEKIMSDNNRPSIKYTLETCGKSTYILNIDSSNISSGIKVKIYEETYVYAPKGGIVYRDKVCRNGRLIYTDYSSIYLDEDTFKVISNYESACDYGEGDLHLTNLTAAQGLMYKFTNYGIEDYENFNELMNSIGVSSTYIGVPLIAISFTEGLVNSYRWTIAGAIVTSIGALSTFYCSVNNISRDSLKNELTDVLDKGDFNVCLTMRNNNSLLKPFSAGWDNWNGQYINRLIADTVLNVGTDIKYCDIDTGDIIDIDMLYEK